MDDPKNAERPIVLVVEDDDAQRELLIGRLEKQGYEVKEAANGTEATAILDERNVDIVLMDWELPDVKGPDLVKRYTDEQEWLIPFLMLTGHNDPERISHALDMGAFDFLPKPARKLELEARIRAAFRFCKLQRQYFEMAIRDPLTGLYNRRYLDHKLGSDIRHTQESGLSLSVALIDIDHFKNVNDTYGHDIGDVVIKQLAKHLLSNLRSTDYVCRIGGEEFLIVMPETSIKNAQSVMKRILQRARERVWGARSDTFKVTFSCGVSTLTESCHEHDSLIKKADECLYEAKSNGRNRIVA